MVFKPSKLSILVLIFGTLLFLALSSYADPIININAVLPCFTVTCYPEIGCITPFISLMIILVPPISICADSPEEVNATYHLMTPKVKKSQFGTLKDLRPGTNLAFYAHGCFAAYADKLTFAVGLALFHKYDQVILIDWTRGANPRMFGKVSIPLVNIFLCAANSEVLGRLVGNAIKYAVTEKRINPKKILFAGHSAGSHATAFAAEHLRRCCLIKIGETVALDSSTSPFALSNRKFPEKGDATHVTRVLSTFNFPVPFLSDLRAIIFQLGYPFPTSDTDIYCNPPFLFREQLMCISIPMCSHFFSALTFIGSLRNCLYEAWPCIPNIFSPFNTTYTGIRSSVFGARGPLCIRTPINPIRSCDCCSKVPKSRFINEDGDPQQRIFTCSNDDKFSKRHL
ncbi:uncharacterized protein LOC107371127 [Tetranychus urticae]|uniref:Uncharacterized protein n=1 Tax=Tetranychus urticae TaxID=32264 RepID=T1JX92_TETUR|nr:uncharacterized protein LOC107371127 [Tetranychus urticae]